MREERSAAANALTVKGGGFMYKRLSSFMQRAAALGGKGRQANRERAPEVLRRAFAENKLVFGYVKRKIRGGYTVLIGGFEAFCPHSKMKVGDAGENGNDVLARHFKFRVLEVRAYSAVVSRVAGETLPPMEGSNEVLRLIPASRYPPVLVRGPGHGKILRKKKG